MEKKEFINMFKDSDKVCAAVIYEKMEKAYKSSSVVFTDEFVKQDIAMKAVQSAAKFGIKAQLFGFFEEAERNIIGFSEYGTAEPEIKILEVNCSNKFRELKHSDYLGAVMSLGLKREKFGDLVLKQGICYIPCEEKTAEYVLENLKQVSTVPCRINLYNYFEIEPVIPDFEEKMILAALFRADVLVSEICNISIRESEELITEGNLTVNHNEIKDKSYIIKENSIISIKKYGKYRVEKSIGESKSGKLKILCNKYI